MSDDAILVHDEHGFTQAMRRQLLLLMCEIEQARYTAQGQTLTWTEDPEGVTLAVGGVEAYRVTYAALAALEENPACLSAFRDRRALVVCRCGEVVIRCRDAACALVHEIRLVDVCGVCTCTNGIPVLDLEDADFPPLQLGPMWDGNLEEERDV
jgi:hypothetical protein